MLEFAVCGDGKCIFYQECRRRIKTREPILCYASEWRKAKRLLKEDRLKKLGEEKERTRTKEEMDLLVEEILQVFRCGYKLTIPELIEKLPTEEPRFIIPSIRKLHKDGVLKSKEIVGFGKGKKPYVYWLEGYDDSESALSDEDERDPGFDGWSEDSD